MTLEVDIPKYHTKDSMVLVGSMLPLAVLINYFLFKEEYFARTGNFLLATMTTFCFLGLAFITYGMVAIFLRNRFPSDKDLFKRIGICLSIFFLMSAVLISLLLLTYDYFNFLGYHYYENDFIKSYISVIVINIFLTFLNEGLYRFERLKATATETEQLKTEYMHSRLLGLKSQMNPHFLFNSLNTLSSLIHEDAERAENFLDHMSKVYRYLLRNNEEQLVTLETELSFTRSYFFLLKARYAEGLHLEIDVPAEAGMKRIPPLTLQMIFEHSLSNNVLSKDNPLQLAITCGDGWLEVKNNIQPRLTGGEENPEAIENIKNKFRLLCQQEVVVIEHNNQRIIRLPLIPEREPVTT